MGTDEATLLDDHRADLLRAYATIAEQDEELAWMRNEIESAYNLWELSVNAAADITDISLQLKERVRDLEAAINATLHHAAEIWAAGGSRAQWNFVMAHLDPVMENAQVDAPSGARSAE